MHQAERTTRSEKGSVSKTWNHSKVGLSRIANLPTVCEFKQRKQRSWILHPRVLCLCQANPPNPTLRTQKAPGRRGNGWFRPLKRWPLAPCHDENLALGGVQKRPLPVLQRRKSPPSPGGSFFEFARAFGFSASQIGGS